METDSQIKMDINNVANQIIDDIVNSLRSIESGNRDSLIDRSKKITELNNLQQEWTKILERLNNTLEKEKKILEDELIKEEQKIYQIKKSLVNKPKSWAEISEEEPVYNNNNNNNYNIYKKKINKREVAPGVYIYAYDISKEEDCHNFKGWWCWCQHIERFCISVNDHIIIASNIIINPADKIPIKFHEHKLCGTHEIMNIDPKSTDFYIPRQFNPNSRDTRQLTNRIKFVPASEELAANDKYVYRIGSRTTLAKDILTITDQDSRLFEDMVGSFMLALVALKSKIIKK